jgi:hypothetical protein
MTILTLSRTPVNFDTPDAEPAESDPVAPYTAEDAEWWAGQNAEWHDLDGEPEPDWDALAEESAATDRLCMGLCL